MCSSINTRGAEQFNVWAAAFSHVIIKDILVLTPTQPN